MNKVPYSNGNVRIIGQGQKWSQADCGKGTLFDFFGSSRETRVNGKQMAWASLAMSDGRGIMTARVPISVRHVEKGSIARVSMWYSGETGYLTSKQNRSPLLYYRWEVVCCPHSTTAPEATSGRTRKVIQSKRPSHSGQTIETCFRRQQYGWPRTSAGDKTILRTSGKRSCQGEVRGAGANAKNSFARAYCRMINAARNMHAGLPASMPRAANRSPYRSTEKRR